MQRHNSFKTKPEWTGVAKSKSFVSETPPESPTVKENNEVWNFRLWFNMIYLYKNSYYVSHIKNNSSITINLFLIVLILFIDWIWFDIKNISVNNLHCPSQLIEQGK